MKTYVVANQKGGIGKTTTATNIAAIMKTMDKKVLLIDSDRQRNSTDTFRAKVEDTATLYDVILESDENRVPINEAIQTTPIGDIIAADTLLERADAILGADRANGMFRMKDALEELTGYDYVIIDTPMVMNSITQNCLIAADEVIIPITADRYAVQGLQDILHSIVSTKKRMNPTLKINGILMVKYDSRKIIDRDVIQDLEAIAKMCNTKIYDAKIRECVKMREAQVERMPVSSYRPSCTASRDYYRLVEEILESEV